jgi:hypothetical protein
MGKKHTPGRLIACRGTDKTGKPVTKLEALGYVNDGYEIARLRGPDQEANAQLFIAAHDMLAALEYLLEEVCKRDGDPFDGATDAAAAAIAKARG